MKFQYTLSINAPIDTVLERFCNPEHYPDHHNNLGNLNYAQISSQDDGDSFTLECEFDVPAGDNLPGFAKKILGDTQHVTQTEKWTRSSSSGELTVKVPALPGSTTCKLRLEADGDTTRKIYDWDINVKIPLVGGKLEKVVADDIKGKSVPDQQSLNAIFD